MSAEHHLNEANNQMIGNVASANPSSSSSVPISKPMVSNKPKIPLQPISTSSNIPQQQQQQPSSTTTTSIKTLHTTNGSHQTANGTITMNGNNTNGTQNGLRVLRPETYVGFDTLPDQLVSRVIRDGFGFNILALGSTGVGKTTLLEALFNTKLSSDQSATRSHNLSGVSVHTQQLELNEGNIKLKLTLVESKGFGDQIDKSK